MLQSESNTFVVCFMSTGNINGVFESIDDKVIGIFWQSDRNLLVGKSYKFSASCPMTQLPELMAKQGSWFKSTLVAISLIIHLKM